MKVLGPRGVLRCYFCAREDVAGEPMPGQIAACVRCLVEHLGQDEATIVNHIANLEKYGRETNALFLGGRSA